MWERKKKLHILLGLFLFLTTEANTQVLVWKDTKPQLLPDSLPGRFLQKTKFKQELEYSFTFSNDLFMNWHHDRNASLVIFLQNMKYQFSLQGDTLIRFSGSFAHNLGFQSYFDSISRFQTDDNTLNTRFEVKLYRNLNFACNSNLTTRLTNGYDYSLSPGGSILRTLNSSFCTPLIWTFSGGFTVNWKNFGSLNLGLSSAKLTFIRDRSIFEKQGISTFYGVAQGKDHLLEYGLSLQFLADKEFFKQLRWNCDLLVFQNEHSAADVTLKNNFGVKINRFLKISILTRILYEEKVSRGIQMENLITIGVYVHL